MDIDYQVKTMDIQFDIWYYISHIDHIFLLDAIQMAIVLYCIVLYCIVLYCTIYDFHHFDQEEMR